MVEQTTKYPIKIIQAMYAVMSSIGYVRREGVNQFHNYKYATETDLLEALRPEFVKQGLFFIPNQKSVSPIDQFGNTLIEVEYQIIHKDGDVWPDKVTVFGAGNDRSSKGTTSDKGIYKASTGANKYFLLRLFQIATGSDPENDQGIPRNDVEPAKGAGADYVAPHLERFVERPHGGTISERAAAPRPTVSSGRPPVDRPNMAETNANPFDATPADRASYVAKFGSNVKTCGTEAELVAFWKAEDKARSYYQIAPDSSEFAQLTYLAAERKAEILAGEAPF